MLVELTITYTQDGKGEFIITTHEGDVQSSVQPYTEAKAGELLQDVARDERYSWEWKGGEFHAELKA